jgi:hypothetical protein
MIWACIGTFMRFEQAYTAAQRSSFPMAWLAIGYSGRLPILLVRHGRNES